MRAGTLTLLAFSSVLAFSPNACAGEEEEEIIVEAPATLADGLVSLGRGRPDRAWPLLKGKEAEARPIALKIMKTKGGEALLLRGAALYLGSPKIWGKEDHPRWRAPLEKRLAKARATLEKVAIALKAKKVTRAERLKLAARKKRAIAEELGVLEAMGYLGTKETWKDLVKLVETATETHVIRGATNGLTGPRGTAMQTLARLVMDLEAAAAQPPRRGATLPLPADRVRLIGKELERVARGPRVMKLVEALTKRPSATGFMALKAFRAKKAREKAWRAVEHGVKADSAQTRAAAVTLVPKLKGRNSKVEFLATILNEDPDASVRASAAAAMGRLKRREMAPELETLIEALKDETVVKAAAGKSLIELTDAKIGPNHRAWKRWFDKNR